MLSETEQRTLTEWEVHDQRFSGSPSRPRKRRLIMDVIQCCAPTNNSNEDVKKEFYSRLSTIIQSCPRQYLTITMGNFNAKTGCDNRGYEEIMGHHGIGETNDNGDRFADVCVLSNLVIGGSVSQHKMIHKETWVSPDLSTENQIDHVCIGRNFRRSLQDVCDKSGADFFQTTISLLQS